MKIMSRLALAGTLAACLSGAVPALAKKAEAPGFRLSPTVVKAAQAADTALQANDAATAGPFVAQAETAAVNDNERYVAAALRYRVESLNLASRLASNPNGAVDQSALAKSLDTLIANSSTPAAEKARYTYARGQLAYAGRQYPVATEYFARARQMGYSSPDLPLNATRARYDAGDVAGGSTELDSVIAAQAAGEKAPADYYRYAIARANKAKQTGLTVGWMNKYATAYPTGQTWYEVLATYGFQHDATVKLDDAQKVDLYRLLRASGGLADQYFYTDYAQAAQAAGLPQEAQAVLKEGMAGGKIPAGSAEAKARLVAADRAVKAAGTAAVLEKKAATAKNGQAAAKAGDARLAASDYAKAAALYRTALEKGEVDTDAVNTHLGIALARSGDKAGAQAAFAAVKGAPRTDIVSFWTTWLNSTPA